MANLAKRVTQTEPSGKESEKGEAQAPSDALKLNATERDVQLPAGQGRLRDLYLTGKKAEEMTPVKTGGRGEAAYSGLTEAVENELRDAKAQVERLKRKGIFKRTIDEEDRSYANNACRNATESLWALALTERLTEEEFERLDGAFRALNETVNEKSGKLDLSSSPIEADVERTNLKMEDYEEILARANAALPKEAMWKPKQENKTYLVKKNKKLDNKADVNILNKGRIISSKKYITEEHDAFVECFHKEPPPFKDS